MYLSCLFNNASESTNILSHQVNTRVSIMYMSLNEQIISKIAAKNNV